MDGVAENTMLAGRLLPKTGLLTPNMFDEFPSNILWLCCWLVFGWLKMNGCVELLLPNCNWRPCPVGAFRLGRCCGSPVAGLLISIPLVLSPWLVFSTTVWSVNNVELAVEVLAKPDPMLVPKIEPPWFCRVAWKLNPGWVVGCCVFS